MTHTIASLTAGIENALGENYSERDLALGINYGVWRHLGYIGENSTDPEEIMEIGAGACGARTIVFSHVADALGLQTRMMAMFDFAGGSHSTMEVMIDGKWVSFDPLTGSFVTDDDTPAGELLSLAELIADPHPIIVPLYLGEPYHGFADGLSPDEVPLPEFYSPTMLATLYGADTEGVNTNGLAQANIIGYSGDVFAQMSYHDGQWHPLDWLGDSVEVASAGLHLGDVQGSWTAADWADVPYTMTTVHLGDYKQRIGFDLTDPGTYIFDVATTVTNEMGFDLAIQADGAVFKSADSIFGEPLDNLHFAVSVIEPTTVWLEPTDEGHALRFDAFDVAFNPTIYADVDCQVPAGGHALILVGDVDYGIGNSGNDTITGSQYANVLDGRGGYDTLWGMAGGDTFLFRKGESWGDYIMDFNGAGAGAGDYLMFHGYGAGASFEQIDSAHWQINSGDGMTHDLITFANYASVHPSDWFFI